VVSAVTDGIKSRGYWDVRIRPGDFDSERVPYEQLEQIVSGAAVRLRGWPVPYVKFGATSHGGDWIGQEHKEEAWRFWTSGQFAHLAAVAADRRPDTRVPEGFDSVIEVWAILFHLTEVTELAARLALTDAGGDLMEIKATLGGMGNRALVVGQRNRSEFVEPYRSAANHYTVTRASPREELLADSRAMAVEMSKEVFQRFGWMTSVHQLSERQRELTEYQQRGR
jgi:hypothetical protein